MMRNSFQHSPTLSYHFSLLCPLVSGLSSVKTLANLSGVLEADASGIRTFK